jgi:hypothetical protein
MTESFRRLEPEGAFLRIVAAIKGPSRLSGQAFVKRNCGGNHDDANQ